jgi:hypothetical protein
MNTTFNYNRFLKVLSNEWRLNIKKMLLFWGGMVVGAIVYFLFFGYYKKDLIEVETTFITILFFFFILQCIYIQYYFNEFSSKKKTQALLLLPASRTETFWAKFLLGVILCVLLLAVYSFFVLKWNRIQNDWIIEYLKMDNWEGNNYEKYQKIKYDKAYMLILFIVWIFSTSVYLLGILSFKKLAPLKTLVSGFIVIMGLQYITRVVYGLFTGVWSNLVVFPGIYIGHSKSNYICALDEAYPYLMFSIALFICLAMIGIARIKYNEKTI